MSDLPAAKKILPVFDQYAQNMVDQLDDQTRYQLYQAIKRKNPEAVESVDTDMQFNDPDQGVRQLLFMYFYNQYWLMLRDAGFSEEEIDQRCCSFRYEGPEPREEDDDIPF